MIFYLWAGVVMTLDGARRLLQAHSMLVPMSRPACTLSVLRVKAHLQATRFPCRGPPPPCHSQVTLVGAERAAWVGAAFVSGVRACGVQAMWHEPMMTLQVFGCVIVGAPTTPA